MTLNICLIHEDVFKPSMPARPAITEIYGNFFPSFGHKVTWITPTYKQGEGIEKFFFNKVCIYAVPFSHAASLPRKIFNFFSNYIREYNILKKILKEKKIDIIQVRNNVFYSLIVLFIKKRYDIPFIFQYSFPKALYKTQIAKKWYIYYWNKFEGILNTIILKKADFVFPISKWMEREFISIGIPKSKMMVVPMGCNHKVFSSSKDGKKIQEKYGFKNSKIILYSGIMEKSRKLDVILHAFSKIINNKNNLKLLMVGDGTERANLEKLASSLGLKNNVIFTGQVSYYDMPEFIAASDICLCPIPPLNIHKISSPTKLFEYMIMKKPVVANEEIPEQKEVIEECNGGILVKFDEKSFANGITKLLNDPKNASEMGEKGYEWVIKNRSYEKMARKIEKKYYEIIKNLVK